MRAMIPLLAGWLLAAGAAVGAADEAPAMMAAPAAAAAMTMDDACCKLTDLKPGPHKMTFVHPYTCCPVEVCFCLPCGCYELKCSCGLCAEKLRFQYAGLFNDVVIRFTKDGGVSVRD